MISLLPQYVSPASRDGGENLIASVSVPTEGLPCGAGQAREGIGQQSPLAVMRWLKSGSKPLAYSRGGRNQSSMSVPAPANRASETTLDSGKPTIVARGCRHRMVCEISRGGHATFHPAQRQHRQAAQGQTEKRREASWWASELSKTVGDVAAG